jgi:hypothetical protein
MNKRRAWSQFLCVIGVVALFRLFVESGEGLTVNDFVPLAGGALIAVSAFLVRSRFRWFAYVAFGVTAVGVGGEAITKVRGALAPPIPLALLYFFGLILCLVAGVCIFVRGLMLLAD